LPGKKLPSCYWAASPWETGISGGISYPAGRNASSKLKKTGSKEESCCPPPITTRLFRFPKTNPVQPTRPLRYFARIRVNHSKTKGNRSSFTCLPTRYRRDECRSDAELQYRPDAGCPGRRHRPGRARNPLHSRPWKRRAPGSRLQGTADLRTGWGDPVIRSLVL